MPRALRTRARIATSVAAVRSGIAGEKIEHKRRNNRRGTYLKALRFLASFCQNSLFSRKVKFGILWFGQSCDTCGLKYHGRRLAAHRHGRGAAEHARGGSCVLGESTHAPQIAAGEGAPFMGRSWLGQTQARHITSNPRTYGGDAAKVRRVGLGPVCNFFLLCHGLPT